MGRESAALAVLTLSLVNCCARADNAKDDLRSLKGAWDLVSFERDGRDVKVEAETKVVFTGGRFVVKRGDQVISAGTVRLHPTSKPKALDTTYTEGRDKGKTFKGIYRIEGNVLRFCRAGSPDHARPAAFETKPGSGQFLSVYRRARQ